MPTLTPGMNVGLSPQQLKQTLGGQGGQEIVAYLPDPSQFTGVAGTEYAPGSAPNLQYVSDTIHQQYTDKAGNLFQLMPSNNPGGLSDPGTYLKQISGAPTGYAQTPQELLSSFKNFTPLNGGSIYENVAKNEKFNILPGETEQDYYKRTGVGYSPAFGGQMPGPIIPTAQSISQGLEALIADINKSGITQNGKQIVAPGAYGNNPQTGQFGVMTAEGLQGGGIKAIKVPTSTPTSLNNGTTAATTAASGEAMIKQLDDYIKLLTPPETAESKQYKDLMAQIQGEIPSLTGRGEAQLAAEEAKGVQAKTEALQTSKNQLSTALAEYKAIQAQYNVLSTTQEGRAVTMNTIIGAQAQINKMMLAELNTKAADIALIQAQVAGLQGDLDTAQKSADRSVNLKYSDANDLINAHLKQLELIKGELTTKEKIRSDAVTAYLASEKEKLANKVAEEKVLNTQTLKNIFDYQSAGITMGDSIETQREKILKNVEYKTELAKKQREAMGTEKPPTLAQETVAGYASRIEQSNPIIGSLQDSIVKMNFAKFKLEQKLPSALQSDIVRQFNQAALNFINAKLRQESGAVIGDPEYVKAEAQYLPQPGDDAITLKNKSQNRELIFNSLKNAGGSAYTPLSELVKEPNLIDTKPPLPTNNITEEQLKAAGATPVESYSGGIIENILSGKFFNFLK